MFKLCLVATLLVASAQAGEDPVLSRHARMVGGQIVNTFMFPYVVGIRPKRSQASVNVNLAPCTGVLIEGEINPNIVPTPTTNYYVLTTASCVMSGTTFDLFAGVNKITPTMTATQADVAASTAIINDEYFNGQGYGDLAIIPTTIVPGNSAAGVITAVKLIHINEATKGFLASGVTMAGWGMPNDKYSNASPSLRYLSANVVPTSYCAVRHLTKKIGSNHICTGGLINKGPCTGDSGAPLVINRNNEERVLGLATLTPDQGCSKGAPGIFTHLGPYLAWIASIAYYNTES